MRRLAPASSVRERSRRERESGSRARGTGRDRLARDRKSTRLNSSHRCISYAVFCLKNKLLVAFAVDVPVVAFGLVLACVVFSLCVRIFLRQPGRLRQDSSSLALSRPRQLFISRLRY